MDKTTAIRILMTPVLAEELGYRDGEIICEPDLQVIQIKIIHPITLDKEFA